MAERDQLNNQEWAIRFERDLEREKYRRARRTDRERVLDAVAEER